MVSTNCGRANSPLPRGEGCSLTFFPLEKGKDSSPRKAWGFRVLSDLRAPGHSPRRRGMSSTPMWAWLSTFRPRLPHRRREGPEPGVLNSQSPCCKPSKMVFLHQLQFGFQAPAIFIPAGMQADVIAVMKPWCAPSSVPEAFGAQLLHPTLCIGKSQGAHGGCVATLYPLPAVEGDAQKNLLAGHSRGGVVKGSLYPVIACHRPRRSVAGVVIVGH